MPDAFHAEFTGERVIPGAVEENLFNEHLARYRFAAHFIAQLQLAGPMPIVILDAGCGAGYGAAELADAGCGAPALAQSPNPVLASVLAIDISTDALTHARAHYPAPHFTQASCLAIPARDASFRLIAAFEVIEHLDAWREFLQEMRRVLHPQGFMLVSTPNRLYYAESRQSTGPNPFHVHEFTAEEFRTELQSVFPHVKLLLQNHVEGVAFSGADTEAAPACEIRELASDPSAAHFFLALASLQPIPPIAPYVFIPETGNVLQTRERHIALLDGEIRQKNQWIEQEKAERARMIEKVRQTESELEEHNRWARAANAEADRRARLVAELQNELRASNEWAETQHTEAIARGERVVALQEEVRRATEWARAVNLESIARGGRIIDLQEEVRRSTDWAHASDAEAVARGLRIVELQDEVQRNNDVAQTRINQLEEELRRAAEWAQSSNIEAEARGRRILELQDELLREQDNSLAAIHALEADAAASSAAYESAINEWRRDKEAADRWAVETERRLSAERDDARAAFASKQAELERATEQIASLEAEKEQLTQRLHNAAAQMDLIAQSRWLKLGRLFRLGPEIRRSS